MENSRQTKMIRLLAFIFTLVGTRGVYMAATSADLELGAISLAMLTVCGFAFWYLGKSKEERKEPDAFLTQLKENKNIILNGGWEYKGAKITTDTILAQYFFTFSLITISFKIPSRFYIIGQENTTFVNFVYTFLSLLLGWWAIPLGPVYTLQSLTNNLKGGNKVTVESLVNA